MPPGRRGDEAVEDDAQGGPRAGPIRARSSQRASKLASISSAADFRGKAGVMVSHIPRTAGGRRSACALQPASAAAMSIPAEHRRIGSPSLTSRSGAVRMVKRGSSFAVTSDQRSGQTLARQAAAARRTADDGLAPAVLAEVDVDLAFAGADHPGDGGDGRKL